MTRTRASLAVLLLVATAAWWLPSTAAAQTTVTRGPYLQLGTPTSVVVRWRTASATDSRVHYGTDLANLSSLADAPTITTDHEVTLAGLTPDTRYFYSIGTTAQTLAGGDANHFFVTSPPPGTVKPTHIWVLGDSGTANANARAVRDAYLQFKGPRYTDLWLMLGDNAYKDGTDSEYQAAVFNLYPTVLRQTVLWPTLGNHDGRSADSASQTGVYYDIFTLPRNGEAGGLASGTEAYYSFDYGNIHFVVLESFETSRAPSGAMMTWLRHDLANNTQPWIIAYWHHPPYSKGSHNSDTEIELVQMRQNALPILEAGGVDLVLTGHSHSYERSFLIDGHYGSSSTFTASMKKDGGDGRLDGTGEYQKPEAVNAPHEGAVYAVAGSSGQTSGGSLNHPVMFVSLNTLGSMILDINGDRLDALFLDSTGARRDYFSIVKGLPPVLPAVTIAATEAIATEAGPTAGTFTVSRTGGTTELVVFYTVSGTATPGSDFTALSGSVTVPANASSATITVTPIDDTAPEGDELVIVALAANAAYAIGTSGSATVTITSNDVASHTVAIMAADPTATEAGPTTGTLTVSRTGSTASPLTVFYSVSGTATPGSDHLDLAGSVLIPAGATSAPLVVTPIDDAEVERDEWLTVTLTASAPYLVGSPDSATLTILSEDVTDAPLVRGITVIKDVHITDLRLALDSIFARMRPGEPLIWLALDLRGTTVRADHIQQLRDAVERLLGPRQWVDPRLVPGSTWIRADHIEEIRGAVRSLYPLLP